MSMTNSLNCGLNGIYQMENDICVNLRDLRETKSYRSIATAFFTASTIRSISSLVL